MSTRRERQKEILISSKKQLNEVRKLRRSLIKELAEKKLSIPIVEAMVKKATELKKKIEEMSMANIDYERQMYEDN